MAGVVNYRSYDDLRSCLASLKTQSHAPLAIAVVDHDGEPRPRAQLASEFPGVEWQPGPNAGYSAGANRLLQWAQRANPSPDFVLLLNPDVVLAPAYAELLVREMCARPEVALASGKLLRPGGRMLDSAGIRLPRHRRPRDRGANQLDKQQYDRSEDVFAVTGAAMMLRRTSVADLEVLGEVFDEDFFQYHEDTDLSWRAHLLGWDVRYVPGARAQHRRRWRPESRAKIEPAVRRHSFKNHYLQLVKNESGLALLRDLPVVLAWECVRLAHALLRDPAVLPAYGAALRLLPRARSKRQIIQARARTRRGVRNWR